MRTTNVTFEATVTVGEDEAEVTVEASCTPGFPGTMYARNGDPGDPPEPAEAEITSVSGPDGEIDFDSLSQTDQHSLYEKALEEAGNQYQEDDHPGYED